MIVELNAIYVQAGTCLRLAWEVAVFASVFKLPVFEDVKNCFHTKRVL